jgi:hypothetical protein
MRSAADAVFRLFAVAGEAATITGAFAGQTSRPAYRTLGPWRLTATGPFSLVLTSLTAPGIRSVRKALRHV